MSRAGFGTTPDELDYYSGATYEELVENLLNPKDSSHIPDDIIFRDHVDLHASRSGVPAYWAYRMISTKSPLVEKMALFWHGLFATGNSKLNNLRTILNQIDMFRRAGSGRFDDLLIEVSRDPAMLIWLDNQDNVGDSINENYGREILELFSMGVGNYSEDDIKECARAFTGWSVANSEYMSLMAQKDSIWPYGRIVWHYDFNTENHDGKRKNFLGESGDFNGDDVIEIICRQESTAKFISRHLYNFFVADEVPVPQWKDTPPRDPQAIDVLVQAYFEYDHDIKSVMRVLLTSDFFKEAGHQKVKSPAELVIGTLRLSGEYNDDTKVDASIFSVIAESDYMGQALGNPPSVEGWHTGEEWITSGALVDRINFASKHMGDLENDGVRKIIDKIASKLNEETHTFTELVESCCRSVGITEISNDTRTALLEFLSIDDDETDGEVHMLEVESDTILRILKFMVSSREYQLC
jgi:uncharacterized protein (DUF1800 family)